MEYPKDVLMLIALELDLPDLLNYCVSNPALNKAACENEFFWLRKLERDFPKYPVSLKRNSHKETYQLLHSLKTLQLKIPHLN